MERTAYAEQLVSLAERMSNGAPQPALSMARRSDLSLRIASILNAAQRRGRAGLPASFAVLSAAALVVLTIAPLRAVSVAPADGAATATSAEHRGPKIVGTGSASGTGSGVGTGSGSGNASGSGARSDIGRDEDTVVLSLDHALYEAVERGDINQVIKLIDAGANVNAALQGDGSPLIAAAREHNLAAIRVLLDRGADVNLAVHGDGNPLIMAAREGHADIVDMLLTAGARIDEIVPEDENALIRASAEGHLDVVQLLVTRGANVNARAWADAALERPSGEWRTPLNMARRGRHDAIVTFLLSAGARE